MGHQRGGFTFVETVFSVLLFATMLGTIMTTYLTGQNSFMATEANLQASQGVRMAVNAVQEDLETARIYSYYDGYSRGIGKSYVKFHRPDTSAGADNGPPFGPDLIDVSAAISAAPKILWEDNAELEPDRTRRMSMYIWCTNATAGLDPCRQIDRIQTKLDKLGQGVGPLMLVRSGLPADTNSQANPNGENNLPWTVVRVVAQNVTGFKLTLLDSGDQAINQSDAVCANPSATEGCVRTFGGQVPKRLDFEVLSDLNQFHRQRQAISLKGRVTLTNPQS